MGWFNPWFARMASWVVGFDSSMLSCLVWVFSGCSAAKKKTAPWIGHFIGESCKASKNWFCWRCLWRLMMNEVALGTQWFKRLFIRHHEGARKSCVKPTPGLTELRERSGVCCRDWKQLIILPQLLVISRVKLLLMEEILHQSIGSLSHNLRFFSLHPRWLARFLPSTVCKTCKTGFANVEYGHLAIRCYT